ncbi:MAG: acyl-CoA thioesterase [Syntrophobacteraceae bacterium]
MRPKPFIPQPLDGKGLYVRDRTSGLAWHRCSLRTLYADTDRSTAVYHANYLRYFEFGRASLMRDAAYAYREIEESGYTYPVISTALEYFSPLGYDDAMYIHTRPAELQRVKLRFDYVITHASNGEIVTIGFTRHCAVNSKGRPVSIDNMTLELWNNFPV